MRTAMAWAVSIMAFGMPATGAAAEAEPIRRIGVIGDLTLPYDPFVWTVEGNGQRYTIGMVDDPHGHLDIDVTITEASGARCSPDAVLTQAGIFYEHAWERHVTTIARPGFDLHVATLDMGCRNWTGSPVFACAAYQGKVYSFTADRGGCDTPPQYDGPVIGLLGGGLTPK